MLVNPQTFSAKSPRGFIVVEGVNGAGKSTVLKTIEEHLQRQAFPVIKTFEPGDTALGKELRKILLSSPHLPRHSTAELLLFGADRSEHVDSLIIPALERKEIVLCDRYLYSTIAFQGYGRGLDIALIDQLNTIAVRNTLPDLVILLDIDAEEGLRRTRGRTPGIESDDIFELETIEFHRRIRDGFLALAKSRPEPFMIIDAHMPLASVQQAALAAIDSLTRMIKK